MALVRPGRRRLSSEETSNEAATARGHINLWIAAGSGRAGIRGAVRVAVAGRPGPRTGPGAPSGGAGRLRSTWVLCRDRRTPCGGRGPAEVSLERR